MLPTIDQASFNHSSRQHDFRYPPNSHTNVLTEISKWADGHDARHIFWLNGMAGTGKSTIARAVSQILTDRCQLGGSFFFSRGGGDLGHAGKMFTTLASQLSQVSVDLNRSIYKAAKQNSDIAVKSWRDQWQQLVIQPLSDLTANACRSPLVFVIDALDECDDDENVRQILRLLAEEQPAGPVRLQILVTSRAETPIRLGLRDMPAVFHYDLILHDISRKTVDHDIGIYFREELKNIEVSEHIIQHLIKKACGLFTWAATTYRFIKGGMWMLSRRFSIVLDDYKSSSYQEDELDKFYTKILSDSTSGGYGAEEQEQILAQFRSIVGAIVMLSEPVSCETLAKILEIPQQHIKQTLNDLQPILEVPEDQQHSIQLLHPSFRDFLLNDRRCRNTNFLVIEEQAHRDLAKGCIRLMSGNLSKDICNLGSPGILRSQLSRCKLEQYISAELRYSCRYWVFHILHGEKVLRDGEQTHLFIQKHFLHWIEVLSLIGEVADSVRMVAELQSIVVSHPKCYVHL